MSETSQLTPAELFRVDGLYVRPVVEPGALTPDDIKRGWILPCQAKCSGPTPLVIDFDEKY